MAKLLGFAHISEDSRDLQLEEVTSLEVLGQPAEADSMPRSS